MHNSKAAEPHAAHALRTLGQQWLGLCAVLWVVAMIDRSSRWAMTFVSRIRDEGER